MTPNDETLREFLVESHENLDGLERDLVTLEASPRDPRTLAQIFRTIHTIKGTCGFLALPRLEAVAHAGESLLCDLRDGRLSWHPEITGAMLGLVDAIRGILRSIEAGGGEGDGDDRPLIVWLQRLQEATDAGTGGDADPDDPWSEALPAPAEAATGAEPGPVDRESARAPAAASATGGGDPGGVSHGNVRVDVGLLDKLMNLVGELVLTRNQILQHAGTRNDSALLGTSQRLNLITTELQEGVMKTRMQPIGTVWNKFPRVVRDLAVGCGKQVHIDLEGRETELDRTIIEAIKDPLTHLVRNAIDHGIEVPEARLAAGKPVVGQVRLRAYHESGQVNIEMSDDGAGIDPAKIAQLVIERGLMTREQVSRLDDRELIRLVFLPGFSTAERVTNLSGRGVGMDVVKTNIEKIGGTVDLHSRPGEGTTLKIKIPLTLAIIPALIVTAGGDRYAIPQVNLLELVRLEGEQVRREIETVKGTPIYRLRGHLLPLVDLGGALGRSAAAGADDDGHLLDFEAVKALHLRWKDRLVRMIAGHERIEAATLGSSGDCELGRWMNGPAGATYGERVEFQTLKILHDEFHHTVRTVVEAHHSGRAREATEALSRMDVLSLRVIRQLDAVEQSTRSAEAVNIVVLQSDGRQFGLMVENISDTEEIVVKPLGKYLKGLTLFAGATIMGDGRVALILDVAGFAQRAGLDAAAAAALERETTANRGARDAADGSGGRQAFLLFRLGTDRRVAIPMNLVSRLEEIRSSVVERAAGREVVQYRDQILPLVHLSQVLGVGNAWAEAGFVALEPGATGASHDRTMPVIVYRDRGRGIGFVVDEILDVVEDVPRMQRGSTGAGLLGSAVIQKHVTDLLDVEGLIRMAGLEASDLAGTAEPLAVGVGAAGEAMFS